MSRTRGKLSFHCSLFCTIWKSTNYTPFSKLRNGNMYHADCRGQRALREVVSSLHCKWIHSKEPSKENWVWGTHYKPVVMLGNLESHTDQWGNLVEQQQGCCWNPEARADLKIILWLLDEHTWKLINKKAGKLVYRDPIPAYRLNRRKVQQIRAHSEPGTFCFAGQSSTKMKHKWLIKQWRWCEES